MKAYKCIYLILIDRSARGGEFEGGGGGLLLLAVLFKFVLHIFT